VIEFVIGAGAALGVVAVARSIRQRGFRPRWWQWLVIGLNTLFAAFTALVIGWFLEEGAFKAALVAGALMGFIAVLGTVVVWRLVFGRQVREARHAAS
jgi:hypothetical protein